MTTSSALSNGQVDGGRPSRSDRYEATAINEWAVTVLTGAGLSSADALTTAECLMFAETRGVTSHGLARLEIYLSRLTAGGTIAVPVTEESHRGAVAVIDAGGGAGPPAGLRACAVAANLARDHGIGLALVRNTNHCGALGYYAGWLAEQGMVAIVLGNADPIMAPPGGGVAVLGSNPLAMAVPPTPGSAPLLDMATTAAAYGKILASARRNEPIPAGWAVDRNGRETTDADAALEGALLPAAGPKGFGLAFMIDLLTAGLAGGRTGTEIVPLFVHPELTQGVCLLVLAIDPAACAGSEALDSATERISGAVRASRDGVDGAEVPMLPGEREQRHRAADEFAIVLEPLLVERLQAIGATANRPLPAALGQDLVS